MRRTLSQIAQGVAKPKNFRGDGPVRGPGTGTSDSIPAMLSDGEFVLPADTVRKVGVRSLRDLIDATHTPVLTRGANHLANGDFPDDQAFTQKMEQQRTTASRRAADFGAQVQAQAQAQMDAQLKAISPPAGRAAVARGADAVSQIPTNGYPPAPPADGSQRSWSNTETGRNLSNLATALPGSLGGVIPAVAKTGGAISGGIDAATRLSNVGAGAAAISVLPSAVAAQEPAAPMAGAGRGMVNPPMVDPSRPLPSLSPSAAVAPESPGYGPIGDRTTLTNEQAATMNPAGRITVKRGANGTTEFSGGNVSGQVSYNDTSGKALSGGGLSGRGFSAFEVAPASANVVTGSDGSYAFATETGPQQSTGGQRTGYNPANDQRLTGGGNTPNMQAPDARFRLLAAGGGQDSAPVMPGSFTGGYSGTVGSASTYGNMRGRSPEQRLRDAEVSASSITNKQQWGGRGAENSAAMQGYRAALQQDSNIRQNQAGADLEAMRQTGLLQREGMQQAGEIQRAGIRAQSDDAANQIARGRLSLEQVAAGYTNRSADRLDKAQAELEAAKTPEAQRSARERLLALAGKAPQNEWAVQVTPTTKNLDGSTTQGSVYRYNKTTGETARVDGGQQMDITKDPRAVAIRDNAKLSPQQKWAELQRLGYL